jgi:hypothetical protein
LDLDAWINDPPSESEDESVTSNSQYNQTGLFHDGNGESYQQDNSHGVGDTSAYQNTRNYTEPTVEELEKQRDNRKQSEKINPFYLKDTTKSKLKQKVYSSIKGLIKIVNATVKSNEFVFDGCPEFLDRAETHGTEIFGSSRIRDHQSDRQYCHISRMRQLVLSPSGMHRLLNICLTD